MKFIFTDEELRVLTLLIDAAIKAGGLQTAEAGLYFVNKFKTPLEDKPEVVNEG